MSERQDTGARRPDRRQLLRLGGLAAATAAVAAACGKPKPDDVQHTGNQAPSTSAGVQGPPNAPELPTSPTDAKMNIQLLQTMTSIELLTVEVYAQGIGSGKVTDPLALAAMNEYQTQHQDHAAFLQRTTRGAGGKAYLQPNDDLATNFTTPTIKTLDNSQSWVAFLASLESLGASSYVVAVSTLTKVALRHDVMRVGGVSARRAAALRSLAQPDAQDEWVPDSVLSIAGAFPQTSLIGSSTAS